MDGARTRGPVIAIRYRDLRQIAKLVNDAIGACPDVDPDGNASREVG